MCEIAAAISKDGGKGREAVSSLSCAFHRPAFPRSAWLSTDTQAAVHLNMMTLPQKKKAREPPLALRAARENVARWMEMSPESSSDGDRMEQWASTAKLRRIEVERIETLLAEVSDRKSVV